MFHVNLGLYDIAAVGEGGIRSKGAPRERGRRPVSRESAGETVDGFTDAGDEPDPSPFQRARCVRPNRG
ncbi:hypothetical protein GCM10027294_36320 [Marinactinospora endophytica]